ncbi:MAG: hypothetical protein KIG76_05745 [Eubacteriales bacterium]|nr:hypothetical protein [Candidatus Colimorpha enterica]
MRERIASGRRLIGTMLSEVFFPNISVILKNCGYDFVIIDCEHGPYDCSQVSLIVAMARANGISAVVRIPEIRREPIIKYLDMGADGLLVPMVRNAADAARVVDYVKYPPDGNRGISISRAHSGYAPGDVESYLKAANRHTAVLIQIELEGALEDSEKIAALPGVDALMVGPSDLSMDLGIFNRLSAPELLNAVSSVSSAAEKHGKSSGIITADRDLISASVACGMNIICTGSEVRALSKGFAGSADEVRKM